ncbi:uncharacterized protein LOC122622920 isoform X2 [Drosophila teissieri]|uniref:uncharacterized protein LOC122622920 isoform X2 n=1 Tax=Drosophila teissieri TaxID=7243 RepID=UPI001CBA20C6|nr:uncharacterized protein LOC122622920 isoform X2 [Drosophila teissieri]
MDTQNPNSSKISSGNGLPSKKYKSKRSKTNEHDNQNINMKKSFSKFDDLQKRNVIHSTITEKLEICHQCKKPVYKMEEVILRLKTETTIFHKTCLRCNDCGKHLKFDSYNVHDGSLYCSMHFKLIFAPKVVYEEFTPRKPELIIRENQPIILPPDVARASDKPSLGLDELQQLNLRSKFKVFENGFKEHNNLVEHQDTAFAHKKSIQSTLTKLHKLGIPYSELQKLDDNNNSDNNNETTDDESDVNLMCSKKDLKRETPVGLGEAMNDIRSKFEQGDLMAKEGRREERKQEIQNIRSRLFLGKQAKIKEMYKLAVAESELAVTSVGKTADILVIKPTQEIKNRFENGEVFKDSKIPSSEVSFSIHADADVFESGISKASRNIFMELDANIISGLSSDAQYTLPDKKNRVRNQKGQENTDVDVIKSDSKPEEVKVATEELSQKFKFFETYSPAENKKKIFRMTPPREGVEKLPTPDSDPNRTINTNLYNDNILQTTKTMSTILNKFREMEEQKMSDKHKENTPKPLKCFTPPPEISRHFITSDTEDESESDYEQNSEGDEKGSEIGPSNFCNNDNALHEAQNVARAKQLRAKFEKWQDNEIEREINEGRVDIYSQLISNESIESAKTIRERFENMKNSNTKQENTSTTQIKRFVAYFKQYICIRPKDDNLEASK